MAPTTRSARSYDLPPDSEKFLNADKYDTEHYRWEDYAIKSEKWEPNHTGPIVRVLGRNTMAIGRSPHDNNTTPMADPWHMDGPTANKFVTIGALVAMAGLMVITIAVDCYRKRKMGQLQDELRGCSSGLVLLRDGLRGPFTKRFWKRVLDYLKKLFTATPAEGGIAQKGKNVASSGTANAAEQGTNAGGLYIGLKESPFTDRELAMRREMSRISQSRNEAENSPEAAIAAWQAWHQTLPRSEIGESSKAASL